MHKYKLPTKNNIHVNTSYQGETIENKVQRITNNKEPIKDGAPLIYTDRSEGVLPSYNVRTDRFEAAIDAMDVVAKSHAAKREMRTGEKTYDTMTDTQQKEFNTKYPKNKHNKQPKTETGGPGASTNDSQA